MMSGAGPKDQVKIWNEGRLDGAMFLDADYRHQRFERHFHDEYAIGIIEDGCQAFSYDGGARRMSMCQGTVALISPGVVHEGRPANEAGWRYKMLYPSSVLVDRAREDAFGVRGAATFDAPCVSDPVLYALIARLHWLSVGPICEDLQFETLFSEVIVRAFTRHGTMRVPRRKSHHRTGLGRAGELIQDRYEEALTVVELAAVAGLSKFEFVRQFRDFHGVPPHAYLRHVRLVRARDLIRRGVALANASAATGFSDQAHMTRVFKATLGITPGQLARAMY